MKLSVLILIVVISESHQEKIFRKEKCAGRWQILDQNNVRITFDWQIDSINDRIAVEFRPNLIGKSQWYGFTLSSSTDPSTFDNAVYVLRWEKNEREMIWDSYRLNETTIESINSSNVSFQRSLSSGLLTVHLPWIVDSNVHQNRCFYLIYLRGRIINDQSMFPDEIRFNRSLCLNCSKGQSNNDDRRKAWTFFWMGRVFLRSSSNDYSNLTSTSSENLRLQLQNLFISLIHRNSSWSFLVHQFDFYALQYVVNSQSIVFAMKIVVLSDRSANETLTLIDELIQSLNTTNDSSLSFDPNGHSIRSQIDPNEMKVFLDSNEFDFALHLLLGSIVSLSCLMLIISTLLCLYGYYKCQRRQYRLFLEQQTMKYQSERTSYQWLGQTGDTSTNTPTSSPYLIQSTSI